MDGASIVIQVDPTTGMVKTNTEGDSILLIGGLVAAVSAVAEEAHRHPLDIVKTIEHCVKLGVSKRYK